MVSSMVACIDVVNDGLVVSRSIHVETRRRHFCIVSLFLNEVSSCLYRKGRFKLANKVHACRGESLVGFHNISFLPVCLS